MKILLGKCKNRHTVKKGQWQRRKTGFWFVSIHTLDDDNGRIAIAITDMALAQDEKCTVRYYSFSAQIMKELKGYYKVLEISQKGRLELLQCHQ